MTDPILQSLVEKTTGVSTGNDKVENGKEDFGPQESPNNIPNGDAVADIKPDDLERTFEPVLGVSGVSAPVEDVTKFFAGLQKEKIPAVDQSKMITDLTYKNKHLQAYLGRLHEAYQEALKRGEKSVFFPPLPPELFTTGGSENAGSNSEDMEEAKYMKELMKMMTQHEMMMKIQDRYMGGGKNDTEDKGIVELTYPDGSTYKGPADRAPHLMSQGYGGNFGGFGGQPQGGANQGNNDAMNERLARIEQAIANPFANEPKIEFVTGTNEDGTPIVSKIPINAAERYGLIPKQTSQRPQNDEHTMILDNIVKNLIALSNRIDSIPTQEQVVDRILDAEDRDANRFDKQISHFEKLKNILNPTPTHTNPETGLNETELAKERIKGETAFKLAKEEKEKQQWKTLQAIGSPDPETPVAPPIDQLEETGKEFLRKMQYQARREGERV